MELEDIKPVLVKYKIERLNKEYEFRLTNLNDEIWLRNEYGNKVGELFTADNIDMEALCRLAFRLMTDKSEFKKQEIVEINEYGEEITMSIGGYKLFMGNIRSNEEKSDLAVAIGKTVTLSRPELEHADSTDGEKKKK